MAETTQSESWGDIFAGLVQYGGKAYIDKHTTYQQQPSPNNQRPEPETTQTAAGQASPNAVLGTVAKYQTPLLFGFGGLLAFGLLLKAVK